MPFKEDVSKGEPMPAARLVCPGAHGHGTSFAPFKDHEEAVSPHGARRLTMSLILLIVLVVLLLGSVPAYPYSRRWGYGPSGLLGLVLILLLLLMVAGVMPPAWGPYTHP
jgi:hypothetical protein